MMNWTILRKKRYEAGLEVNQVAAMLGVASGSVYQWESGRRKCPANKIKAYAELIGMEPKEIVEILAGAREADDDSN